ncbi:uncharacterized protein EI97DRAFT_262635, partial [Westerdykella ornata]
PLFPYKVATTRPRTHGRLGPINRAEHAVTVAALLSRYHPSPYTPSHVLGAGHGVGHTNA